MGEIQTPLSCLFLNHSIWDCKEAKDGASDGNRTYIGRHSGSQVVNPGLDQPSARGGNVARILAFTSGTEDWRKLLAHPKKQWRTGYSARTLAYSWEAAEGFPQEVAKALQLTDEVLLEGLKPILAIPEFKVPLPGGVRPSQNDLFVLARGEKGPVSIMVEGKVNESFGPRLGEWRADASRGKKFRLRFLLRTLGLMQQPAGSIRYQLLHRAASAIVTAEQFRAVAAVMLVHSFSEQRVGWSDYQKFAALFGVDAIAGVLQRLGKDSRIPLFGAWVVGNCKFLKS